MSGPPIAVALVRKAVRDALADLDTDAMVLVACSGGADSLALAEAARFERPRCGLVTVDHGLQPGSGQRADRLADWARGAGFTPVDLRRVTVGRQGGPEAAARTARYTALQEAATEHRAAAVLLGHTADDQAETVLLGLARGSGARSLAGMPVRRGPFRRPLLDLPRQQVRSAVSAEAPEPWEDPHNSDPTYARARVRSALQTLQQALGPGLQQGLVRTAALLRADADALEQIALERGRSVRRPVGDTLGLDVQALAAEPEAIRTRIVRTWLLEAGSPAGSLGAVHVEAVDALVTHWRGQGPVAIPGGLSVARRDGVLGLVSRPGDHPGPGT